MLLYVHDESHIIASHLGPVLVKISVVNGNGLGEGKFYRNPPIFDRKNMGKTMGFLHVSQEKHGKNYGFL
jgi:hypothetical protein